MKYSAANSAAHLYLLRTEHVPVIQDSESLSFFILTSIFQRNRGAIIASETTRASFNLMIGGMAADRLSLAKPCNACRRRKVRCDKSQPCSNCVKHGVVCQFESDLSGPGIGGDQNVLHERIDKLERLIANMSSSHRGHLPHRLGPDIDSPSRSSRDDEEVTPRGVLLTEPHVSYYMTPSFWMNQQDLNLEPRCLLRVGHDDAQESAWPFGIASSMMGTPSSLAHMHLPLEKENLILEEFWKNVEPFVKLTHRSTWKTDLGEFRRGVHQLERVIEAAIFAQQLLTIASMTGERVQQLLGQSRDELITHFRTATEMAMTRANILRSRAVMSFQVLLYYIVSWFKHGLWDVKKETSLSSMLLV